MKGFKAATLKKPRIPKVQEFYENLCEQPFPVAIIVELKPKCLDVPTGLQQTSVLDAATETTPSA